MSLMSPTGNCWRDWSGSRRRWWNSRLRLRAVVRLIHPHVHEVPETLHPFLGNTMKAFMNGDGHVPPKEEDARRVVVENLLKLLDRRVSLDGVPRESLLFQKPVHLGVGVVGIIKAAGDLA